jgi:hypothetical protein
MADDKSGYQHNASDRKLDQASEMASDARQTKDGGHGGHEGHGAQGGAGHDPAEIRKHDDDGKDRLFEGRQQHDEAEKNSEKTRLARDVDKHHHTVDDDVADAGTGPSAKRKS